MKLKFVPSSRDHGWYYTDENGQVIFAQGQPIPVSVASEIAGCVNAGWRQWHGGIIPALAVDRVDIQLRDGEIWQNQPADDVSWQHDDTDGDVVFWRPTTCGQWWRGAPDSDANGWHDIEAFQLANQRMVQHDERHAGEWPDESIADRDPTAIMGGIVLAPVEQPEPPTLTVAVSAPAQPAKTSRLYRVMNGILLCQASALTGQALFAIGKGWPLMAVAATATAMWAIHAATR